MGSMCLSCLGCCSRSSFVNSISVSCSSFGEVRKVADANLRSGVRARRVVVDLQEFGTQVCILDEQSSMRGISMPNSPRDSSHGHGVHFHGDVPVVGFQDVRVEPQQRRSRALSGCVHAVHECHQFGHGVEKGEVSHAVELGAVVMVEGALEGHGRDRCISRWSLC
eukprot:9474248-Pyramimonas_sp.AAC.1